MGRQYFKIIKRIITLFDDIVMDIKLHPGEGGDGADDNSTNNYYDKRIIDAFTTETVTTVGGENFCEVLFMPLHAIQDDRDVISLQQATLKTIQTLIPYCHNDKVGIETQQKQHSKKENTTNLKLTFNKMKEQWKIFLSDSDSGVLEENIQIIDSIVGQLKS